MQTLPSHSAGEAGPGCRESSSGKSTGHWWEGERTALLAGSDFDRAIRLVVPEGPQTALAGVVQCSIGTWQSSGLVGQGTA